MKTRQIKSRLEHRLGYAGVDEAGRGPLAGPCVVAAVILPDDFPCDGLDDSKKLDAAQRLEQEILIREHATWVIELSPVEEIDRLNILWATMAAMSRAVKSLPIMPAGVLVDGNRVPPGIQGEAIIKGDGRFACIAAASILAKTERDRMMVALADDYPEYGFDEHFGYPTPDHLAALAKFGPCPIHRRSFAPCRPDEQLCLTFGD